MHQRDRGKSFQRTYAPTVIEDIVLKIHIFAGSANTLFAVFAGTYLQGLPRLYLRYFWGQDSETSQIR